jgi:hypothetical protein
LPELSFEQRRGLLLELEEVAYPLPDLNLLEICNSSPNFFGAPASFKRRAFQKKFDYWKRLSPQNYKALLKKHNVEINRFRHSTMSKSTKATMDVDDEDDSSGSSGDSTTEGLEERFSGLKFTATPTKAKPPPTPASRTPNKSRTSNKSRRTPPIGKNSLFDLVGDGTKERPWRIPVDPEYPERNVAGFWVQPVETMTFGRYERSGYHIRSMADPNFDLWLATIPRYVDPGLEDRVILIRKPSVSPFFQTKYNQRYHEGIDCVATQNANNGTLIAIDDDEERKYQYFLLIFPKYTVLDNRAFSPDDEIVQMGEHSLKIPKKDIDADCKKDVRGVGVYWRIADKGGRRIEERSGNAKKSQLLNGSDSE